MSHSLAGGGMLAGETAVTWYTGGWDGAGWQAAGIRTPFGAGGCVGDSDGGT